MVLTTPPPPPPTSFPMAAPLRMTVLISGQGTNLQALISACHSGTLPFEIVRVISNRKGAYGLQRAKDAGIACDYLNFLDYKKQYPENDGSKDGLSFRAARGAYDRELAERILADGPDLVVCAGWMQIVTEVLLDALASHDVKIINLHPALPGMFDGKDAIERAWEAYQRGEITETGVVIHHVIADVDKGEPIVQEEVKIAPHETLEELKKEIHEVEWKLIVEGARVVGEEIRQSRAGKANGDADVAEKSEWLKEAEGVDWGRCNE